MKRFKYLYFTNTATFTLPASANGAEKFDFRLSDLKGGLVDITIENFKLVEAIE